MKSAKTYQLDKWIGGFGKAYTDRNIFTVGQVNDIYKKRYGVTRTSMNKAFIGGLSRSVRILEVGSNVGNQLKLLQEMGFRNLYGIEPQGYAVEASKKLTKGMNIINGSAFDIPFRSGYFDLVFTSGVLIHINPEHVKKAMREICRCARRYVWGLEYYSPRCEKIEYRGESGLLWKADFPAIYRRAVPGLKVSKIRYFNYSGSDNVDAMFLLRK